MHPQQEELRVETERHLGGMAELATMLQTWTTPTLLPPLWSPDGGEAMKELREASRQPEVGDEVRGSLRLPDQREQPLQPEVDDG